MWLQDFKPIFALKEFVVETHRYRSTFRGRAVGPLSAISWTISVCTDWKRDSDLILHLSFTLSPCFSLPLNLSVPSAYTHTSKNIAVTDIYLCHRGRLMFPIYGPVPSALLTQTGKSLTRTMPVSAGLPLSRAVTPLAVVGFGARSLGRNSASSPQKYLNSQESVLFQKVKDGSLLVLFIRCLKYLRGVALLLLHTQYPCSTITSWLYFFPRETSYLVCKVHGPQ